MKAPRLSIIKRRPVSVFTCFVCGVWNGQALKGLGDEIEEAGVPSHAFAVA